MSETLLRTSIILTVDSSMLWSGRSKDERSVAGVSFAIKLFKLQKASAIEFMIL